jgi:hypothetical protein
MAWETWWKDTSIESDDRSIELAVATQVSGGSAVWLCGVRRHESLWSSAKSRVQADLVLLTPDSVSRVRDALYVGIALMIVTDVPGLTNMEDYRKNDGLSDLEFLLNEQDRAVREFIVAAVDHLKPRWLIDMPDRDWIARRCD